MSLLVLALAEELVDVQVDFHCRESGTAAATGVTENK